MKNRVLSIIVVLMLVTALVLPGTRTTVAATSSFTVVSDTSVMVTKVNGTSMSRPADLAWEPYEDGTPSVWDDGVRLSPLLPHDFVPSGADWIWESYRTTRPVLGDIVYFEKTFNVPGAPTAGTLWITCDNGYEAYLNGKMVATGQLTSGWETSNLWQGFVDTNNWQSVETANVWSALVPGDNVLMIKAANEYMNHDDLINLEEGTPYSNPAGLIFELGVSYGELGSTRTWGYWKTHSWCGSAPRDITWDSLLPSAERSPFFVSGQTYCEVLGTSVAGGNAYYQLAHQYIAAQLNGLSGAWMSPDAKDAFNEATLLLNNALYSPATILTYKKGTAGQKAIFARFNELAGILDAYNNGLMGTPHAD